MSNDTRERRTRFRDPAFFGQIYRAHARAILVFLTRRTYDPETALDLTAETFAQAFAARRRFRGATDDDLAAWLFGIARNVLARYQRKGRAERRALERLGVEVPPLEPEEAMRVIDLAGLAGLRSAVARELGALPGPHRDAVTLRVVEELAYEEVAHRLGISQATARARVSRGLRSLGARLDHHPLAQESL